MSSKVRVVFFTVMMLFPSKIKIWIYNNFFSGSIHPTAQIGFSYINVKKINMGENSYIGHLNIINNLESLDVRKNSSIKNLNRITAVPLNLKSMFKGFPQRNPTLILGEHSYIVSRNFFDCCDQIEIGSFSTIAGSGTSFYTHGINIKDNRQDTKPILIGKYCLISAGCIITKGVFFPDYSVLGANSTLQKSYAEKYVLYSGVPAIACKKLDQDCAYFFRSVGKVD